MFEEPQESLPGTAKFHYLVEDKSYGFLHSPVGILLQPVTGLHVSDRGGNDKLAPFCLLVSRRKRALAQKIEFVLIEGPFQAEQQTVVALSWCVDRLLVDQHGIDDAAHLDELLPVAAVAGKPRHLPRRHRADLAETDFGHHAIEAGAFHIARGRAAEIFVDRFQSGTSPSCSSRPRMAY